MHCLLHDPDQRLFILRLARSFYALRVTADGQVVHVGSGPLAAGAPVPAFTALDRYHPAHFGWDQQAHPWELPTLGDTSIHDPALVVAFPGPPPAAGEAAHAPVVDLRLRCTGHEIVADAQPGGAPAHGQPTRDASPRPVLRLHLRDLACDFRVALCYRPDPARDVLERWIELDNRTGEAVEVRRCSFATLHLAPARWRLHRTAGVWAREFTPVEQALEQGRVVVEGRGLITGHAANPAFLLHEEGHATEESGSVWFGALAWSGNWSLRYEVLPGGAVRVHGGYEHERFALRLAPGERHVTPAFVMGCADDGLGGASRRLHRFARERVLPPGAQALRPVLYNNWEATYFDLTEDHLLRLAQRAAAVGVELFCIDDGWFGGRRHDRAGLGDWEVSAAVFPRGLAPLAAEVHRLGMRFGLWVEPEMVNPDSDLYRAHPDWVLHWPGRPRSEVRNQLILDLGRPEVVEHLWRRLDALVREIGVDFFKWDMNRYVGESGSLAGDAIWRAHAAAVYSLWDRLRRAHPRLEIQSCAGGGGRVDLGALSRTDQVWTSDNTDAHHRVRIQEGFTLAYPPRAMEAWVTSERNHQTGRLSSLELRFAVAMRGALGLGDALDRLPEAEIAAYAKQVAFYKRIRPVVLDGDLYRLETLERDGRSTWLSAVPGGDAVLSQVVLERPLGLHRRPPALRALDPAARYRATDHDGNDLGVFAGAQLATLGLPDDIAAPGLGRVTQCRTVLLTRA